MALPPLPLLQLVFYALASLASLVYLCQQAGARVGGWLLDLFGFLLRWALLAGLLYLAYTRFDWLQVARASLETAATQAWGQLNAREEL